MEASWSLLPASNIKTEWVKNISNMSGFNFTDYMLLFAVVIIVMWTWRAADKCIFVIVDDDLCTRCCEFIYLNYLPVNYYRRTNSANCCCCVILIISEFFFVMIQNQFIFTFDKNNNKNHSVASIHWWEIRLTIFPVFINLWMNRLVWNLTLSRFKQHPKHVPNW